MRTVITTKLALGIITTVVIVLGGCVGLIPTPSSNASREGCASMASNNVDAHLCVERGYPTRP